MKKLLNYLAVTASLLGLLGPTSLASVLAATAPSAPSQSTTTQGSGQALEIAPPVINLVVNPGQTTKVQIFLRDISSTNLIVTGTANDFVAAGEDGTPKILLTPSQESSDPYSLKDWIAPIASLQLVPKQIQTLNVTINVPANASPGGHYGVIRFTATPANLQTTGVSLSASVGSLVLVTVNGNIKESLGVQQFSVSHGDTTGSLFESTPLTFTERLKNNGNVHVQPSGQVTVTDMFGKKVATLAVNQPPGNVLPNSVRKFKQNLDSSVLGSKKLFGHYTAKLDLTYGTGKQHLTSQIGFWVLPYRLIAAVIIILIAGFFGLRAAIRRYNRRIIERANRGGGSGGSSNQPPSQPPSRPLVQ